MRCRGDVRCMLSDYIKESPRCSDAVVSCNPALRVIRLNVKLFDTWLTARGVMIEPILKTVTGSQLVLPNHYQISTKWIAGCLLVMTLNFRYTQRFSELFHGSARAIIRSLECGLAWAVASESDRSPQTWWTEYVRQALGTEFSDYDRRTDDNKTRP